MKPVLVSIDEQGLGRRYQLPQECLIGRLAECHIQLVDSEVSKEHARIFLSQQHYFVEDLGSLNGVLVNGLRIAQVQRLNNNDALTVGGTTFLYNPDLEILPLDNSAQVVVVVEDSETRQTVVSQQTDNASGELWPQIVDLIAELAPDEKMLSAVLRRLGQELDFDAATLLMLEGEQLRPLLISSADRSVSVPRDLVDTVIHQNRALAVADASGDTSFIAGQTQRSDGNRSLLLSPLVMRGQVIGLVCLQNRQPGYFQARHLQVVAGVTPLLAVACRLVGHFGSLNQELQRVSAAVPVGGPLLGESAAIAELKKTIGKVAGAPSSVLITGETGTGKELVAQQLHELGPGVAKPFIAVNCGALPEHLVESELFGHEKGAFTGADKRKPGKLELANGGTLFMDEIGELPPPIQVKLLRALQEKSFYRLGGVKPVSVAFRIVAATNRNLKSMIQQGTFREDLYYRINVIQLHIPPLRERRDDIAPLLTFFLERYNRELGKQCQCVETTALKLLQSYSWPGNIRELKNVVERMVVLSEEGQQMTAADLPLEMVAARTAQGGVTLAEQVAVLEERLVLSAMRQAKGKKVDAARLLGVSRPTLDKKIGEYGIDIFDEKPLG